MVTEITKKQAADLYLSQLQSEAAKLSPVDREIKRYLVKSPKTGRDIFLSIVELMTEVQNQSQIGMLKAVAYVQQLEDSKGEPLYIIV